MFTTKKQLHVSVSIIKFEHVVSVGIYFPRIVLLWLVFSTDNFLSSICFPAL